MSEHALTVRPGSIRQTTRDRILGLVESVPGDRKIVILDEWTVRVVDAVCSLHDILDSGAFLVEVLHKKRQPYPTMQAVYFVSPSIESFDAIARDFDQRDAIAYSEVHILATGRIGDELMRRLANSPVVSYVKTLKEVYLDFLGVESRVFTVGGDARLMKPGYAAQAAALADVDRIARQIAAACVTMGERPVVRYHRSQRDQLGQKAAAMLNEVLDRYAAENSEFVPRTSGSELIIVSRSFDMIAPLLHEFTYQAMVSDLLGSGSQPLATNNASRYHQGPKTVNLDEGDSMWTALRHTHIADCSKAITERFRVFVSENKAAARQVQQKRGVSGAQVASLNQLKDIMGSLGEFQEMKSQFTLHMEIAEKCFAAMDRKHLMELARIEQILACGCDAQGEPVKNVWGQVAGILPSLSSPDRARLLALYFATAAAGMSDGERQSLVGSAGLDRADADAVRQYLCALAGHWRPGRGDRKSRFHRDDDEEYEVSRFVPQLQLLAEDACRGTLDPQVFPAVASSAQPSQPTASAATSLRSRPASQPSSRASRSTWIFVIGGCTWSEARAIYLTSQRTRMDCFLGSTHIISPEEYLSDLRL